MHNILVLYWSSFKLQLLKIFKKIVLIFGIENRVFADKKDLTNLNGWIFDEHEDIEFAESNMPSPKLYLSSV